VPLLAELSPRLLSGEGGTLRSPDDGVEVAFPPTAFAETVFPRVRAQNATLGPQEEIRALSPLYTLQTGHVPQLASCEFRFFAPTDVEYEPDRVGVFVKEHNRYRYIGGEADASSAVYVAQARTPLPMGLFEDRVAPRLDEAHLELTEDGHVLLRVRAADGGAGIDCEDVQIVQNGEPLLLEFDDETGDVLAWANVEARSGAEGTFEIQVMDRCGNETRRVDVVRLP